MATDIAQVSTAPLSLADSPGSIAPDAVAIRQPRWRLLLLGLAALDVPALIAAFGLAYLMRFKAGLPLLETPAYTGAFYSTVAMLSVPVWLGLLAFFRLYDRRLLFAGAQEYVRIANACTTGLV